MSFVDLIPLALLGGVLGLDVVSFPQAMISRPLVAATLGGALIGESASGVLLGAALELIALETLPFGASRYPEWGSAAVVGGAIFATHPSHPAGAMSLAVLAALATTWVGGWTMVKLRQRNAVWAGQRREALEAGARGTVISLQLMGMTADLVRGTVLTALAYASLSPLADWCMQHWSMDARLARDRGRGGGERCRWSGVEAVSLHEWRAMVLCRRARRGTLLPVSPMTGAAITSPAVELPFRTRMAIFIRLLAIQGSWNYEILLGNGMGFCLEPALRLLPGGIHTPAFHQALARESRYFNAHPYLAAVAVGALARAELDGEDPVRIERFRTALCGPLGSVGDRLVWAGWLPFCSLASLAAFGWGASAAVVVALFLITYNIGHFGLRIWGLNTGWTHGLRVASALGNPVLRRGPQQIGRLAALATGIAIPLALGRIIGPGGNLLGGVLVAVALGSFLIVRLQSRIEGWRLSLIVLAVLVLFSVIR